MSSLIGDSPQFLCSVESGKGSFADLDSGVLTGLEDSNKIGKSGKSRYCLDDRFWGGISYRMNDAVALLLGMELFNGLKLGYSFDLVTSSIGYYGFSSHEIFISYSVNLERNRNQKYKSIRFL